VCREARDGACVMYVEENSIDSGRHGTPVGVRAAGQCTDEANQQNCEANSCNVQIGSNVYCSQCKTGGNVPIDGVCVDKADAVDKCLTANNQEITTEQVCGKCGDNHFLFKGGCYNVDTAPGNLICSAIDTANTAVCKTCAAGYFKNPAASDATHQSCIACSDTTGADSNTGVANCATCDPPETSGRAATCTACADGYYDADCANSCDESCKSCTGAEATICTSCKADTNPYFKKGDGETGECVAEDACTGTHFPTIDANQKKICTPCNDASNGGVADCQECSKTGDTLKCLTCNNNKKPNTAGTACVACTIADCANCNEENVCEACTSNKKLSPLKDACLDGCPAGTYDNTNVCTPCHTSCSSCSDAASTSCTACYPGHVLNKSDSSTTGTCIPECTGRYAENCEKDMCTADIGGSKYCSKCKSGFVPVDGICVSAGTTRVALTGCTSKGDGTCSACTDKYFLQSGGCYQSTVYPGNTLCSSAADGKCTNCANGQTADQQTGSCPVCPAGCSKCSGSSGSQTCSECLAGYYKSGTSCAKCSENSADGKIQGVENCVSCAAPTSNSGPFTCYVTQDPTVDPTDPSVNKGGLSSGAIAGISVAVIVVVGGLVGFFCWWFVCRGKA
ncbi:Variant-specific surface protein, partial [Giardia duodenalis]